MEISFGDFIRAIDERNRAYEMALQHAASILTDLKTLSLANQQIVAGILIDLLSFSGDET